MNCIGLLRQTVIRTNLQTLRGSLTRFCSSAFRTKVVQKRWLSSEVSRESWEKKIKLLANNVIIYKYERPGFFRAINIFALTQWSCWWLLTVLVYASFQEMSTTEDTQWFQIGHPIMNKLVATLMFSFGFLCLCGSWLFSTRSVRSIALLKGGNNVIIQTYAPFAKQTVVRAPVEGVSCKTTRQEARGTMIPLKLQGYKYHFILDKKGEFPHPELFDVSIGLKRNV